MVYSPALKITLLLVKILTELFSFPRYLLNLLKTPKKCPPIRDSTLLLSATELAERIRKRQITSLSVVEAYISRINEVNPIINAVIENRFQEALQEAKKADDFLQNSTLSEEEVKEKYPLLGIPVTVKGSIAVTGLLHTAGNPDHMVTAETDATVIKYLKEAGAIPMLMSNTPEMCCSWETTNKFIGTTSNPYDNTRTCGGSSGGEGSLLGSAASVVGIGSDLAGSLRLPAHYCGVFGHKPSPNLVSWVGHYPSGAKSQEWKSFFTIGPMTRYAKDLKLVLNIIAEPNKKAVLKLNQIVNLSKIKVYYMEDMESIIASRLNDNVTNALKKVITHFNKICDSKCIKIQIPIVKYCAELSYLKIMSLHTETDDMFAKKSAFYEFFLFLIGQSKHVLGVVAYAFFKDLMEYIPKASMSEITKYFEDLRKEFLEILGEDGVLIIPTTPSEAIYHGDNFRKNFDFGYCSLFNVVGFPVTTCPVGFSKSGLPIGIQVVAGPNLDRLTVSVAEELEKAFGGWKF